VRDPLAEFLGAAEGGIIDYSYADAVRLAGHSCPTVASAYWLTCRALALLYPDDLPERGGIEVGFLAEQEDGTTGVTAAVVGLLTGAAHVGGFKGVAGRFVRQGLTHFANEQPLALRFLRRDSGTCVDACAHLNRVVADPALPELMAESLHGTATAATRRRFGELWQARVARLLLEHGSDPQVFELHLQIAERR
jgi:hypothetical protein